MLRPSGDHANAVTPSSFAVTFSASPPRMSSIHTCCLSVRADRNASFEPSGDQAGDVLDLFPNVSWRVRPVPASASQTWFTYAFPTMSVSRTVYATNRPSGDTLGPFTRRSDSIWSIVGSVARAAAGARPSANASSTSRLAHGRSRRRCTGPPDVGGTRVGDAAPVTALRQSEQRCRMSEHARADCEALARRTPAAGTGCDAPF